MGSIYIIFSTAPVSLFIYGSMVPMPGSLDPTGGDQLYNVATNEPEPFFPDSIPTK